MLVQLQVNPAKSFHNPQAIVDQPLPSQYWYIIISFKDELKCTTSETNKIAPLKSQDIFHVSF